MIVLDASLAAKLLFPEEHAEKALDLVTATLAAHQRIVAPSLLPIEVANILRQRMRRADLDLSQAIDLFERFLEVPITTSSPRGLSQRALTLAEAHQLPAVYDAHYLALAESFECDFWTADKRLLRAIEGKLPFVKWIGDYPSR